MGVRLAVPLVPVVPAAPVVPVVTAVPAAPVLPVVPVVAAVPVVPVGPGVTARVPRLARHVTRAPVMPGVTVCRGCASCDCSACCYVHIVAACWQRASARTNVRVLVLFSRGNSWLGCTSAQPGRKHLSATERRAHRTKSPSCGVVHECHTRAHLPVGCEPLL